MPRASRISYTGIQKTPVDSSATLVTRHATSQSARRCRSVVNVRNDCTGVGVAIGRHRDHVRRGTTVNPRRIGIDALQHIRRRSWRTPDDGELVGHAGPSLVNGASGHREYGWANRLLNGITTDVVSPLIRPSLPGPRYSSGTAAPVSRRPRRPDAAGIVRAMPRRSHTV